MYREPAPQPVEDIESEPKFDLYADYQRRAAAAVVSARRAVLFAKVSLVFAVLNLVFQFGRIIYLLVVR